MKKQTTNLAYGEREAFTEIQFVKNKRILETEPKVSHQYLNK